MPDIRIRQEKPDPAQPYLRYYIDILDYPTRQNVLPSGPGAHPGGSLALVDAEGGDVGPVHRPNLAHPGAPADFSGVFKVRRIVLDL